ncbi:hypothetical protein MMC30_004749 [Trapelia coarctata]|nr:hypothetical protein [Trapelia coarctata]
MDPMEELILHITTVADSPDIGLDTKLIGTFDRSVTGKYTLSNADREKLLNFLSYLIPTLQQDPKPVTDLIQTVVQPASFTFSNVLVIQPPVDFVSGLCAPNVDINLATLRLLGKACAKAADAGIIAANQPVVAALVRLWLCTPDTEVALKALWVMTGLLRIDISTSLKDDTHMVGSGTKRRGQGLMWRRVFQDKDIYELFFSICSLSTAGQPGQPSKREKTIAQSRILDFVLTYRNFEQVTTSQLPEVEAKYGVKGGGLLDFVASHMVDYKDDMLMHATLMDFFTNYLRGSSPGLWPDLEDDSYDSSDAISFLISKGLHARTMSYYLEPETHSSLDITYVYPRSAEYVAAYASRYPPHLLRSGQNDAVKIVERLSKVLSRWPSSNWGHGKSPTPDLHVLASLPRATLLQDPSKSPFFDIPVNPPNADALNTLATVFCGPLLDASASASTLGVSPQAKEEAAAARALYFYYLKANPSFWARIASTAEIIALKENALAAINVIDAVVGATWEPLPAETDRSSDNAITLPTEAELERYFGQRGFPLAPSGAVAILSGSAQAQIIPYLLRPAQTFGKGDAQSAAYAVAVAKHETVIQLHRKLKEALTIPEQQQHLSRWQPLIDEIERCATWGVWGGTSVVGGRVGTLEL